MTLKEQFKKDRDAKRMTSTQVAAKLGISKQALCNRLNCDTSFRHVQEIWGAMGYKMGKCFNDEDGKTRVKLFASKRLESSFKGCSLL